MEAALRAAERAKSIGDRPVGAVLVWPDGTALSHADTTYSEQDATGHACINVLRKATQTMRLRLSEATLVSTLEPCRMCAEAARLCGVREVVFGAYDLRDGGYSTGRTTDDTVVKGGVLGEQCRTVLPAHLREHTSGEKGNG